MKKVRFLYNPLSGENKILALLDYIVSAYQDCNLQIEPFRISSKTPTVKGLEGVGEEHDHILIAGGDGTISRVVNEYMNLGLTTPIALLPAGTANDFANFIGYDKSLKKAVAQILSGEITDIDLGKVNGEYFINVLSAGLFTEISQKTPTFFKNTFGKLAYYMSSLSELPNFKNVHLRIDSKDLVYDDNFLIIFVFNGKSAGNFQLAHQSDIYDGLLDILIIRGDNVAETITTAFYFFTRQKVKYPKGVIHFKAKELSIMSDDELRVDIDGEVGPNLPLKVSCLEKALKIIVPKKSN